MCEEQQLECQTIQHTVTALHTDVLLNRTSSAAMETKIRVKNSGEGVATESGAKVKSMKWGIQGLFHLAGQSWGPRSVVNLSGNGCNQGRVFRGPCACPLPVLEVKFFGPNIQCEKSMLNSEHF